MRHLPILFTAIAALCLTVVTSCTSCKGTQYAKITGGSEPIPLYAENDETSTIVGYAQPGEVVIATDEYYNGWDRIEYGETEVYISDGNIEWITEDGETDWSPHWALFKGVGGIILVVVGIVITIIIVALVLKFLTFIFGLLWSIFTWAVACGALAGVIGYFNTHTFDGAITWMAWGAGIGAAIAIIRIILHPKKSSDEGMKDFEKSAKDWKKKEEEMEREEFPIDLGNGVRARDNGNERFDNRGRKYIKTGPGNNDWKEVRY